jgi:hypothetical protein
MQSFQMRTGWYRLSLDILVVQDRIASWSANSTMDGVWESEPCSLLQFDVAAHFRSPAQVQKILLEHCLPGTSISTQIIAIASLLFPPPHSYTVAASQNMAFSFKAWFFERKFFCCCLPVRFGVIVMSFLTWLLSGGASFLLWFEATSQSSVHFHTGVDGSHTQQADTILHYRRQYG